MAELLVVAFLGGLITGLSPCIVPVLPVVVAGGSAGTSRARPYLIIGGLVVSFSLTELTGSTVLSALGLPQNFLFWLGIGLLGLLALGLMVSVVGEWIERPFARLGSSRYASSGGGFVLGLSLGLVFVPCAGPILAAISAAESHHRIGFSSFVVTLFYALGAALPLLLFAVLAQRAVTGWQKLRAHLPVVRRVAGAVLAVTTLALAFHLLDPLQRDVPGYTSALEDHLESSGSITKQLHALDGEKANPFAKKAATTAKMSTLPRLGKAPNFAGIVTWFNTPGDKPLTLTQLRGKVVLVDFWTYSCINCQRSLPHVEAWYSRYHVDGLEVIGVHSPEFAFEHVVSNIISASHQLGVHYPIAVDNNHATFNAYKNNSWPADYLIDATGQVRNIEDGEGNYGATESDIRQLLVAANPKVHLPPPTGVPDKTPVNPLTPESYLGYYYEFQNLANSSYLPNSPASYQFPATLPEDFLALAGTWTSDSEDLVAGKAAQIELSFQADDVYLVLGGSGTLHVSVNGTHTRTITVSGTPRLYTLVHGGYQTSTLTVTATPGVQAYDFTFG